MELYNQRNFKHGECINGTSRLYRIWVGMNSRVKYTNLKSYKRYKGRGITICDEWKIASNFIKWAKENGYKDNLEIDRINNDGNYEPSNCRFITRKENTRNRTHKDDYGIYYNKDNWNYNIRIRRLNKLYFGGVADTLEQARILRDKLQLKLNNYE